jgi:outer membrane receptor protein involved in Fe transport
MCYVLPKRAAALGQAGRVVTASLFALALAGGFAHRSAAQTTPPPETPQPSEEITVQAERLNAARNNIEPSVGATSFNFSRDAIENLPQGNNAGLNQVLLQAPGVAQDNLANGAFHIRNEHLNVQYRINGVIIPEGLSFFGQGLSPRFVDSMSLITGALPAQYGLRTSGIVDIQTKSGVFQNGGSIGMYGGSNETLQPSVEAGGNIGGFNYFLSGDFMHNQRGINSPTPGYNAIHDETNQEHGFGYVEKIIDPSSKVSVMAGSFYGWFQIPNQPGLQDTSPLFNTFDGTIGGQSNFDSSALRETQIENSHFGIVSYLHTEQNFDYQISAFTKYSTLRFSPDVLGDLAFNGISQYALRQDFTNGLQAEGSYRLTTAHTLRGGVVMTAERSSADTTSFVLPVDAGGAPSSSTPFSIIDNHAKTGWTYSAFAQDEWKLLPDLTVNFGGRFDVVNTSTMENQISPRLNVVWKPLEGTTFHAGYANYFTPPPFDLVSFASTNKFAGTTGAPAITTSTPVKAERAQYFDVGVTQEVLPGLKVGLDVYYKYARNLLDEGQFGAPVILTPFNYHVGFNKGVELTTTYDHGPFSYYGNLAIAEQKAEGISSAQFLFDQATLDYSNTHLVNTDHSQLMTASAGVSYLWQDTRFSVDIIAGTGVRTTRDDAAPGVFNDGTVPSYEQVNFGVSHRFEDVPGGPIEIRADLINAFDETYLIRSQAGIGVAGPQFGPRRTFFLGIRKFFGAANS